MFWFSLVIKPYLISVKEILVSWDPTLHMAIHERIQEATQDGADLKGWYHMMPDLFLFFNLMFTLTLKPQPTLGFYTPVNYCSR